MKDVIVDGFRIIIGDAIPVEYVPTESLVSVAPGHRARSRQVSARHTPENTHSPLSEGQSPEKAKKRRGHDGPGAV